MKNIKLIFLTLAWIFFIPPSYGQSIEKSNPMDEKSIPSGLLKKIHSMQNLKPYTNMTPVYMCGDFDGDNKLDVLVWVVGRDGKRGLLAQMSSSQKLILLGGGSQNLPWDDMRFDEWALFRKWQPINEPYPLRDSSPAPHPTGDYLILGFKDKSNVVLYWDKKEFKVYSGE
jgi:hypothetical protein